MPVLVWLLISLGWWAPARPAYAWPISPAQVVRGFDPPAQPWLPGHRGVDLAAAPLTVVHAAGAGRVVYAGVLAGRGVVSVEHTGGLRTTYEPVTPLVAAGDLIALGAPVGALQAGHPGCPVAACLHWGCAAARSTSILWRCWGSAESGCCPWTRQRSRLRLPDGSADTWFHAHPDEFDEFTRRYRA
jgi:hypothetical protein